MSSGSGGFVGLGEFVNYGVFFSERSILSAHREIPAALAVSAPSGLMSCIYGSGDEVQVSLAREN